jgi:hypothetical protein
MSNLSPRRRSSQDYALRRAESSEPGHGSDPSGLIAHFTWHMTIIHYSFLGYSLLGHVENISLQSLHRTQ